jgi:hypothetical protein
VGGSFQKTDGLQRRGAPFWCKIQVLYFSNSELPVRRGRCFLSPKAQDLFWSSYLFYYRPRDKSKVSATEILIFTFVCASGISENSLTKFDPPQSLIILPTHYVAFNPAFAGIEGNRSLSAPGKFSILLRLHPPLPAILIDSRMLRTKEKSLNLFKGIDGCRGNEYRNLLCRLKSSVLDYLLESNEDLITLSSNFTFSAKREF